MYLFPSQTSHGIFDCVEWLSKALFHKFTSYVKVS